MNERWTLCLVLVLILVQLGCGATTPSPDDDASGDDDTGDDDSGDDDTGDDDTGDDDSGDDDSAPAMWRIESPEDSERTWLVSPDGDRTFLLGVNTVMRDASCDGIRDNWIRRMEPTRAAHREWARLATGESGGEEVDHPYCFNSVGAFSQTNDFDDSGGDSYMIRAVDDGGAGAPYGVVLNPAATDDAWALKDETGAVLRPGYSEYRVGDPYNPGFLADLDAMVAEDVAPRVGDPALQTWFVGNEIGLFDRTDRSVQGVRDFRRHLWSDCPVGSSPAAPQCARHALAAFLEDRYGSIEALNAAWESDYPGQDFTTIVEAGPLPVPYEHDCSLTCRYDLQAFVHDHLLREWGHVVTTRIRAEDPHHLLSSPRLAVSSSSKYRFWSPASSDDPDYWADEPDVPVPTDSASATFCPYDLLARDGDAGFDLVSVNAYEGDSTFEEPWFSDGLSKIHDRSGLPVLVSEFSVRARIDGWGNAGGATSFVPHDDGIDDQQQRGERYQTQIAQFASLPFVVGAVWHAWSDRYLAEDPDRQINLGLVQCDDPDHGFTAGTRWDPLDDYIAETNCGIIEVLEDATGL